jgi:hypothetical protein
LKEINETNSKKVACNDNCTQTVAEYKTHVNQKQMFTQTQQVKLSSVMSQTDSLREPLSVFSTNNNKTTVEAPKTNKNANKTYSKYNALLDEVDSDETDDLNLNLNSLPTLYQLKLNNFKNKNIIYKSDLVKSKLIGSMPINNKNIDQEKGILKNVFSNSISLLIFVYSY